MATTITGPINGSTTYVFNDDPNDVVVAPTATGYQLVLLGNNDTGVGSDGNDTLDGGWGFDSLTGGFGLDLLSAGDSLAGQRDENLLWGDLALIQANQVGGNDTLIGGAGAADRLVGDSNELYGTGGFDRLEAKGLYTELVGDAVSLQYNGLGGNDILIGSAQAGARTLMFGDAITAYGPSRGGDDTLVSGRSDDFMYGDWEFVQQADLFTQPNLVNTDDPFAIELPILNAPQPFSFTPLTFDLIQQDFDQVTGGDPPVPGPNDLTIQFSTPGAWKDFDGNNGSVSADPAETITYVIPQRGYTPNAPKGGADLFVFSTLDEGNDVIFDFNPEEGDRIWFKNGLTETDQGAGFLIRNNGRDTLITYGSSSILLPFYVAADTTPLSDLFQFGEAPAQAPFSGGDWTNQTLSAA